MSGAVPAYKLYLYDGTPPATADDALSGNTLLATLEDTVGGGLGVFFDAASDGVLTQAAAAPLQGNAGTGGTPTFFRLKTTADANSLSTTAYRIQGTVGTVGTEDLVLGAVTATQLIKLSSFFITLPAGDGASAKLSTGLRDQLLDVADLHTILADGFGHVLKIFDGTPPATADAALSGNTLLVTVDVPADGYLTFDAPSAGVISRNMSASAEGTIAATGTPTFFRIETLADTGALSTTLVRIQGTVGTVGTEDLVVGELTASETFVLGTLTITLPAE